MNGCPLLRDAEVEHDMTTARSTAACLRNNPRRSVAGHEVDIL